MKCHLTGSAAGKPVPRPFCLCRACRIARERRGRSLRTRTGMNIYLADEGSETVKYKVDLSPDTAHQMIQFNLNLSGLQHLLVTHPHQDHLDPFYLKVRSTVLSGKDDLPILHVYGSGETGDFLQEKIPDFSSCRMEFHQVDPFMWTEAGDLKMYSLLGNHGYPSQTLNYICQGEDASVLVAWDTGIWREETWEALADFRLDCVFLECTVIGPEGGSLAPNHQNFKTFLSMQERMQKMGVIGDSTPFVAAHIGDNGLLSHEEAQELMDPYGVTVGFDGFLIDFASEHHRE